MPEQEIFLSFKQPASTTGFQSPVVKTAGVDTGTIIQPKAGSDLHGARQWFLLSVASLLLAGFFAAFLVIGRIPAIASLITDPAFYKRCLIVHVNLSLLIWFGAFSSGLFRLLPGDRSSKPCLREIPLLLALGGVSLIMISAFLPGAAPVLSNYVPFIDHRLFGLGFALFIGALALNFLQPRLWQTETGNRGDLIPPDAASGIRTAALATLVATVTFVASKLATPAGLPPEVFYELVVWGGGHVLQVANVAAMAAIWLFLIYRLQQRPVLSPATASILFGLLILPHMFAPLLTAKGTTGLLYHHGSTQLMRWGIFPVVSIILILSLHRLFEAKRNGRLPARLHRNPAFIGFTLSTSMTIIGFILGAMIRGSNTMVPAHYHAAIGAVTVAFMAMAYFLLPVFGREIRSRRWKNLIPWQLSAFGIGQLVFAIGFAIGGTFGLGRKAYGAEQHIASLGEHIGLAVMGIGGLIAMIGGLLFLAIMAAAWLPRKQTQISPHTITNPTIHSS